MSSISVGSRLLKKHNGKILPCLQSLLGSSEGVHGHLRVPLQIIFLILFNVLLLLVLLIVDNQTLAWLFLQ